MKDSRTRVESNGSLRTPLSTRGLSQAARLDAGRVTKKFYGEFSREHLAFAGHVGGVEDEHDRRWYASVLLNRLMFVYFLQSKGFVRGHEARHAFRYLQDELKRSRGRGLNRYHREFLDALFFEGFAKPEGERSAVARKLVGVVPHLAGGLFRKHPIEERWPNVAVPDAAFESLFRLFDGYAWNLDDAPGGRADEITPDVLGYVFEKHINQKAFGAYYTPAEITQYLCEQTIYQLVLERVNALPRTPPSASHAGQPFTLSHHGPSAPRRFDSMAELLLGLDASDCRRLLFDILPGLKLLDPACGSGAFLVAALKTLTNVYAAVISRIESLRDAGLRRWLGGVRREHPSLDYFVKRRVITDNLFGVDIMEEATDIVRLRLSLALLASAGRGQRLGPLPDLDFNVRTGHSLVGLLRADDGRFERATPDEMLLEQFHALGIRFEQATWDALKNREGAPSKRRLTLEDVRALRPFHWCFEFEEIVKLNGGFDAVITNPPWEIFKPNAKEFFERHSALVKKKKMDIKAFERERAGLLRDPEVLAAWLGYLSSFPHVSAFYRTAEQYENQISVVNGRKAGSDINLYKLFLEQCFNLLRPRGRCGIILQSGVYTDLGTKQLREMLFSRCRVDSLFGLSNEKFIFENVHHAQKFGILVFEKGGRTESFAASFRVNPREAVSPKKIGEFLNSPGERIEMSVPLVRRLSPGSLSVMEFKKETDVRVAGKMLRFPLLGEEIKDGWNFALAREFDMTNDSALFESAPGPDRLELYEGKMIQQFDQRFGGPRYWVDEGKGRAALLGRREDAGQRLDYQDYRLGVRAVASNANARSLICSALPPNIFCGNSLLSSRNKFGTYGRMLFCAALLNSYPADWMIRNKVSQNVNMFYLYQLPVPRLTEEDPRFAPVVSRAARLVCTAPEFDGLARAVGLKDHTEGANDPRVRAALRAELDAIIAHLYDLAEDEFAYILSTFPLVEQSLKEVALEQFRRLAPRAKTSGRRSRPVGNRGEAAPVRVIE